MSHGRAIARAHHTNDLDTGSKLSDVCVHKARLRAAQPDLSYLYDTPFIHFSKI